MKWENPVGRISDKKHSYGRLLSLSLLDYCAGSEEASEETRNERPELYQFRSTNRHGGGQSWAIGASRDLRIQILEGLLIGGLYQRIAKGRNV